MKDGLVTIITPCYNGEKYIAETIESVQAQTYKDWEMLIVDDGSTDNSAKIVCKYAENDSRIRLFKQENRGSAAARNNGIRRADGQYIALLDADDIWLPQFLEKQIAYMKRYDAVCVCCAYSYIDRNSKDIPSKVTPLSQICVNNMLVMNRIGCLSGLYDSKKYGKVFLHEELKSIRDDYAYWLDIVKLEGIAYGNDEILAKYRILDNSTTGNKKKLIRKQYSFYREYLRLNPVISIINVFRWGVAGIKKFHFKTGA